MKKFLDKVIITILTIIIDLIVLINMPAVLLIGALFQLVDINNGGIEE